MIPGPQAAPNMSGLSVQMQGGLDLKATCANVKLIISEGRMNCDDGWTIWALADPPGPIAGGAGDGGDTGKRREHAAWISDREPPRRVAQADHVLGVNLAPEDRVFFTRFHPLSDEAHFDTPDQLDISRYRPTISLARGRI
ncbi:MAG: hypothetical protein R3D81_09670 [Thalassovita sp.]